MALFSKLLDSLATKYLFGFLLNYTYFFKMRGFCCEILEKILSPLFVIYFTRMTFKISSTCPYLVFCSCQQHQGGRGKKEWALVISIVQKIIYCISTLSDRRVMRTMWLRYSVFSARLFESHRMTCYTIGMEGGSRVNVCFSHISFMSQVAQGHLSQHQ